MRNSSVDLETIENKMERALYEELTGKIEKFLAPKIVFFVGAGVSHASPSNLPLFRELNEGIIRSATGDMLDEDDYQILSSSIRPEVMLQILSDMLPQQLMDRLLQTLEVLMTSVDPNPNHMFLAQVLGEGGCVLTTNYDSLIEKACMRLGSPIGKRRCYRERDFDDFWRKHSATRKIPKGYLFKLHGTIEHPKSIMAIIRDIGKGVSSTKRNVIRYFLRGFNFCFMGYSCQDDFDIFPLLLNTPSEKGVCWFQHAETGIGEVVWGRDILRSEKEKEENKPLGEKKDWKAINANELLLKREDSFKIIGNSSSFTEQKLCSPAESRPVKSSKHEWAKQCMSDWGRRTSDYQRNLFAGLLFHYIEDFGRAERYFKAAESLAQKEQEKTAAQRWLADTYYREETYEDALRVLKDRTLPIHERSHDSFETARVNVEIANNLRRLTKSEESQRLAETTRQVFESKKKEFIKEKGEERYALEYAKCLNVLGLIYYSNRNPAEPLPFIKKALTICRKSLRIRLRHGDVSMAAESENAMGLIFYEQAKHLSRCDREKAVRTLESKSLKCLTTALLRKERVGDYRGRQQCYRNLGLVFDLLRKLAKKENRRKYLLESFRVYEEEANYMKRMPNPPERRLLEVQYRMSGCYIELSELDRAIEMLKRLVTRREEMGDWHNKARALDRLREAYYRKKKRTECQDCCQMIMSIYRNVLDDKHKTGEIGDAKIKYENAVKEILPNTRKTLMKLKLTSKAKEVDDIARELAKKASVTSG